MHNLSISQTLENKVSEPKIYVFSAVLLVDDMEIPWGFSFLPNGSILITEKKGELILFKDNKKQKIGNIPEVYKRGQGGLLDIALLPITGEIWDNEHGAKGGNELHIKHMGKL